MLLLPRRMEDFGVIRFDAQRVYVDSSLKSSHYGLGKTGRRL
mgnify:CR=1 FL=1